MNGPRDERPVVARDPRPTDRERRLLAAVGDFYAGRVRPQDAQAATSGPEGRLPGDDGTGAQGCGRAGVQKERAR